MTHATDKMRFFGRCPYCSTMHPEMTKIFNRTPKENSFGVLRNWTAFECSVCLGVVVARGMRGQTKPDFFIEEIIPSQKHAHEALPPTARKYLQQALEAQGQPDLAAMGAASAIDAMLKERGLRKGTLNERITKAVEEKILTKEMANWAHAIRLTANDPRHADKENPHVEPGIAQQMLEFAETLGHILFVLPAKINRNLSKEEKEGA